MEQLAAISAVLGGFAVAFLSVVLTHHDPRRRVGLLLALATAAAACFLVSALGWSLAAGAGVSTRDATLQRPLSLLFIAGIGLFLAVLGLGGWLRSRALGFVTSALAAGAASGALMVLRRFVR